MTKGFSAVVVALTIAGCASNPVRGLTSDARGDVQAGDLAGMAALLDQQPADVRQQIFEDAPEVAAAYSKWQSMSPADRDDADAAHKRVAALNVSDPLSVKAKTGVKRDEFKKLTKYEGPDIATRQNDTLMLRAWAHDSTGRTTFQVYVTDYYDSSWRFYEYAHDSHGARLDATRISRDVGSCNSYGGCSHYETLGINVDQQYLEAARGTGITFKISGSGGEEVFTVPASYVSGFLEAVTPQ
ncbi:hypothetical protein [Panacagrimonas sp.]|uniref:hypothetical protein n=1 Tax=Panacagrimonas sp. TaxID=2480088 RepID=UPI003B516824